MTDLDADPPDPTGPASPMAVPLACGSVRGLRTNDLQRIAASCEAIATTAKTLQFKTARVVQTSRPFDAAPLIDSMAEAWETVMQGLAARYGVASSSPDAGWPQGCKGSVARTRR